MNNQNVNKYEEYINYLENGFRVNIKTKYFGYQNKVYWYVKEHEKLYWNDFICLNNTYLYIGDLYKVTKEDEMRIIKLYSNHNNIKYDIIEWKFDDNEEYNKIYEILEYIISIHKREKIII